MIRKLWELFHTHLGEQDAFAHGLRIWEEQRWSSADRDRKAVEYCLDSMRNLGLSCVETIDLPADGRTSFGGVCIPRLWTVRGATLEVLEPESAVIADYKEEPCHLMLYSAPTPPEGLELAIDEEGKPGPGGAVFGNISRDEAPEVLLSGQASFIISDFIQREQPIDRGAIQWHNFSVNPFYAPNARGFAIPRRWGDVIRGWLNSGKRVRFRARIDTDLRDGILGLPTAIIPGDSPEEILLTGHMYEMGADDNSFGAGLCLEIMRMIAHLIAEGALPKPARTIRLLLSFEGRGNQAYAYMHRGRKTAAGFILDSVTASLRFPICLYRSPMSNPSFADYFLLHLLRRAAEEHGFSYNTRPLWINDNAMSDPSIGTPLPGLSIFDEGEHHYHNSLDRPDIVSVETMKLAGAIAAVYLYFLAAASEKEICLVTDIACEEMRQATVTRWHLDKVADSLLRFAGGGGSKLEAYVADRAAQVPISAGRKVEVDAGQASLADSIVPTKRDRGFVGLDDLSREHLEEYRRVAGAWPGWISPVWLNEVMFLSDGTRSLREIFEILAREGLELDLESVVAHVLMLHEFGRVDLAD